MTRLVIIFVVAFGLGAIATLLVAINRPASSEGGVVTLEVKAGDGPRAIAQTAKTSGLLVDERPFYIYILLRGKRNSFYPGTYEVPKTISLRQLVATLTNPNRQQISLRILEGWRIADIAAAVAKNTKISAEQFKAAAPVDQYEGYLFPDTYSILPETTADQLVKTMRDNFDRRTKDLNLTKDDVILASIVEREAQTDEDRPKVAGVYLNRLSAGMALQADPTIQYAKGNWDPVTVAEYRSVDSPYNTYLVRGLPPGPISNPGLKSLTAVKQPAEHDYIYFLHDAAGKTYYAKTLDEHNSNKAKYLK